MGLGEIVFYLFIGAVIAYFTTCERYGEDLVTYRLLIEIFILRTLLFLLVSVVCSLLGVGHIWS